jgi:hypothetical protein
MKQGKVYLSEKGSRQSFQNIRKLVYELNMLRRHIGSYPPDHPVVAQTLARVHSYLDTLVQSTGRLVLGITKEAILVGDDSIDLKDPVLRDFARSLFAHGIIAVTFCAGIAPDELRRFNECLMALRQDAIGEEGFSALWQKAALEHIHVEVIDYKSLSSSSALHDVSAEPVRDFWTGFVRGVLAGSITGMSSVAGDSDAEMMQDAPPEMLAELFHEKAESPAGLKLPVILTLLAKFMKQIDEKNMVADPHALAKFVRFLVALKPEVRDYFLQGSFDALSDRPALSEKILENFPGGMLVEALNKGLTSSSYAPPSILKILRKLASARNIPGADGKGGLSETPGMSPVDGAPLPAHDSVHQKLMVLLKEEDSLEQFVPGEYQDVLRTMLEQGERPLSDAREIANLRKTLLEHDVDVSFSHVILELLDVPFDGQQHNAELRQNLLELCGYFVRMGDFSALASIYERLQRLGHNDHNKHTLQSAFTMPDFVDEVLRGPIIWGKQKFDDIASLIRRIGEPFFDPMLDRLAEEQNLSLRRFYVDRIVEYGPGAIARVGGRLLDGRWYYVRNLVVILRSIGNEAACSFLKTLQSHSHPKVRQEVQRALFQFRDDGAYAMLADDIGSADYDLRMGAIRLAVEYHTPDIVQKLVAVVEADGLSDETIETRGAALRTLGAIGDTSCLPGVERILRSRNFFRQLALNRLKEEFIRALGSFRAPAAQELLLRVKDFGSKELVRLAEDLVSGRMVNNGN